MCIVERVGCEDDATIAWTADSAENYCILRRRVVCFTPEASERNFFVASRRERPPFREITKESGIRYVVLSYLLDVDRSSDTILRLRLRSA